MAQFFNFKEDYFGLTDADVEKNTELYGYNIYTKNEKKEESFSPAKVLISPSFLLMFLAGILSFFGTNVHAGLAILLIDAAYAGIEIFFGTKADEKLMEIKASTAMKFRVIRNGKLELIEKEFIVPEDIIVVQEGERVPADAYIRECRNLTADESIFTKSDKPVAKFPGAMSKSELSQSFIYSGTTILSGIAICKVSAAGVDTKLYQKYGEKKNTHQYYTEMEQTVRGIIPVASAVAAVIALISLVFLLITKNPVVDAALRAITIGLCFLPVGVSSVIRFYYLKGSDQLVENGAVVKSLSDIEKLNSVSVLCIEKQGAISKSHLEVRSIYTRSEEALFKIGVLACDRNSNDEAERALMVKATFFDENIKDLYSDNKFIEKIPDSNNVMSGNLWQVGDSKIYCIKGAPEQILPLCRFKGDHLFHVQKKQQEYYAAGYSVMAIACADADERDCDATASFAYTFIGFVAFSAPLRESVSNAIKTCERSGVKVVMLAEDNLHVAEATARLIGLTGKTVTGKQIDDGTASYDADIYAKLNPEQKIKVLDNLKKQGEVVAMTGTRPGDVEALEHADVGITIAQHTAGSTFEAADIIMNNDNLISIANMICAARQIHRNIKRGVSTLLAGYFGLLLLTILNLFGEEGMQLMLNPQLLALFGMLLIPFAAIAYVGNKSDMKDEMPRSDFIASRKINYMFLGNSLIIGLLCGIVSATSYLFMYNSSETAFARSCSLISFAFCYSLFCLMGNSFEHPVRAMIKANKKSYILTAIILIVPIALVFIPGLNSIFCLSMIDGLAFFISVVTGVIPVIGYAIVRAFIKFY